MIDTSRFFVPHRWTTGADPVRARGKMRRLSHPLRAGGALLPAGTGTAPAAHRLLELSRQRGGHTALLVPGEWQRRRVPPRRALIPF